MLKIIKSKKYFIIGLLFSFILFYTLQFYLIKNDCSKFVYYNEDLELNKKIDNIVNLSFEDKKKLSTEVKDFVSKCQNAPFIKIIEEREYNIVENYHNLSLENETEKDRLSHKLTAHLIMYYMFYEEYGSESILEINEESMHEFLLMASENLKIPLKYKKSSF